MNKITKRFSLLTIAFIISLICVFGMTYVAYYQTDLIHEQSSQMYLHPFQVRMALDKVKINLLKDRLLIKELKSNLGDTLEFFSRMEEIKQDNLSQFDILYRSFLGDKMDIDTVKNNFLSWHFLVEKAVRGFKPNSKIDIQVLEQPIKMLDVNIGEIDSFSTHKAIELFQTSYNLHISSQKNQIAYAISISAFLLFVFIFLILLEKKSRKVQEELEHANRSYLFVNELKHNFVFVKNEQKLLSEICRISAKYGVFSAAWAGYLVPATRRFDLVASFNMNSEEQSLFTNIEYEIDGPTDIVERTGKYFVSNNVKNELHLQNWKKLAFLNKWGSFISFPIKRAGKVVAIINFTSKSVNFFSDAIIANLEDAANDVSFAFGLLNNERGRLITEQNLIASERKFELVFQTAKDAIILSAINQKITFWNRNSEILFGYSNEEMYGKPIINILSEDSAQALLERTDNIVQFPQTQNIYQVFESIGVQKDGTLIPIEISLSYWSSENENNFCTIIRDIRNRKYAEMEKKIVLEDIIKRNKDLEQFSYIVSHNLRAPVANILGITTLLQKGGMEKKEENIFLDMLSRSTNSLDTVVRDINNVLQVRNIISEKKEIVLFSELIREIMVSISGIINSSNTKIITDFSLVSEMFCVKSYMYSIFYNLISNGIKYHRLGISPEIEITSQETKNTTELFFKDNGMGIDLAKNSEQVFGLYKRFHFHVEGKGMGLFMVKTQVESMGGKISVESEMNKGTTFKLVFEHKAH